MTMDTARLNHWWAGLLIDELVRCGVDTFFVSPGSRSTPLMVAVARHPATRVVHHFDERAGAFAALGYGRATGRPAGWLTTSGTAVANGLPAAVEAATDGVPMLLLTADRPPEKRDTGANQTITQPGLFGAYVRWQTDLPAPTPAIAPEVLFTTVDQAVHFARRLPPGPVHLNCMFRKPLEPPADVSGARGEDAPAPGAAFEAPSDRPRADRPHTKRRLPEVTASPATLGALADQLAGRRGMLVCGRLDGTDDARAACRLAEALGWPLVPDITSRLRLGAPHDAGEALRVPFADQVLASDAFRAQYPPEAVLHLGSRSLSKRLRLFLKEHRPSPYVVVRPDPRRLDPDHRVTDHVEATVAPFCDALVERLRDKPRPGPQWPTVWREASAAAGGALDDFAGEAMTPTGTLSEPLVARLVSRHRPPDGALVLGSSMPVRDANRYATATSAGEAPTPVFANRGASGIDGTVATAVGACVGLGEGKTGRPVTLVLGDLAMLHDLGALALLREQPVTVVVLNNGGGGIFHFLPIAAHADVFEPHFTTPHDVTFEDAASLFDLAYERPATPGAFVEAYRTHRQSGAAAIIEVHTDRRENRALHRALEERVAQAVEGSR